MLGFGHKINKYIPSIHNMGFDFGQIQLPLTNGPSVKCALKTFLFLILNSMKLGEVLVVTNFH